MPDSIEELRDHLQEQWGLEFSRICHAINAINGEHFTTSDALVSETGLSHRAVGQLFSLLTPFTQEDRGQIQLSSQHRSAFTRLFPLNNLPPDPWEDRARCHPTLPHLCTILSELPAPDRHLDHVGATPITALKRALFLTEQYDLSGASVLLLGDHDMTSLALALLKPSLMLNVADVDERLLSYIDRFNATHGTHIRTFFADFRVELPPSLQNQFDLVFTDPPYSEDGVGLFLQRAICALNERDFTRIVLAYGYGEQQTSLGDKVQSVLHQLRLLNEAIWPRFNHYTGAPSLGQRSDLYILRPTRRSLAAAQRQSFGDAIYTQGQSARESAHLSIPGPLLEQMRIHISAWPTDHPLYVGPPPTPDAAQWSPSIPLSVYFQGLRKGDRSVLRHVSVVINLYPDYAHYALHTCLISNATHLLIYAPQRALADLFAHPNPARTLIECVFSVQGRIQEGNAASVALIRRDTPQPNGPIGLVRHILQKRRARLDNAWREALISTLRTEGITLSKNQARRCIAQTPLGALHAQQHIVELSSATLALLPDAAEKSLDTAREQSA